MISLSDQSDNNTGMAVAELNFKKEDRCNIERTLINLQYKSVFIDESCTSRALIEQGKDTTYTVKLW